MMVAYLDPLWGKEEDKKEMRADFSRMTAVGYGPPKPQALSWRLSWFFRLWAFGVQDSIFTGQGLRLSGSGSGLRDGRGLGFRVQGLGF